ncbi:MAG: 4Fe-4S dicluster domain-containing protein, partial [Polyangiaceae bacterium]|nr:4Fe-4S dicluster domain-containing protein [Polyangiaceae bacterium]
MSAEVPLLEIADLVSQAGGSDFNECMQCGVCTGSCPWNDVDSLSPRRIIRDISLGLEGWEEESVWRCVTCQSCEIHCPRKLQITGIMQSARAVLQDSGTAPRTLSGPIASLASDGNPWDGP